MQTVRVIAVGDESAGDSGAAIAAARILASMRSDVRVELEPPQSPTLAERLAEEPLIVLEVLRSSKATGSIVEVEIAGVQRATLDGHPLAYYGAELPGALELATRRGLPVPHGIFLGVCGRRFEPETEISGDVRDAVEHLVTAASGAIEALRSDE